jgi:hypothetical protein
MPTATRATVRINRLHVLDSSVNTTSEPGSNAEWYLTFIVNGQGQTWSSETVKDNSMFAVNKWFPNIDLGSNQTISISVSGYEQDDTSANDQLPALELTLHPAEDFQLGGTFWSPLAQSDEGSYKIEYTVTPATEQALTVGRSFVGAYRAGQGAHGLWQSDWQSFVAKWNEWAGQGLRLARLSSFRVDTGVVTFGDATQRVFAGVFEPGTNGYALHVSNRLEFDNKRHQLEASGLRLIDMMTYLDGGQRMFGGVFRAGTDAHDLVIAEWALFEAKWQELSSKGLRLVSLDTYVENGNRMFIGAYRAGTYGHALWIGVDMAAFRAKWKEFHNAGLRLIDIASYPQAGKQVFAGVFRAGGDADALVQLEWTSFAEDWSVKTGQGLRLTGLESFVPGLEE